MVLSFHSVNSSFYVRSMNLMYWGFFLVVLFFFIYDCDINIFVTLYFVTDPFNNPFHLLVQQIMIFVMYLIIVLIKCT